MADAPHASPSSGPAPIVVHGLLVCRRVETTPEGELTVHNVVEVLPVEKFPSDVGPLVFVAFVRNLPAGEGKAAFVLHPAGHLDKVIARLPMEVNVRPEFQGRQVALQLRVPSIPVRSSGWFDVAFEWDGAPLATNRFIVGEMRKRKAP